MLKLLTLALTLLLAACANEAPGSCTLAHVTDLPLTYRGMLLTPAILNDRPTTLMLDTGAELTIITKTAAERLHLTLQTTGGTVSGVGGWQELYFFIADTFRIGVLHGENLVLGASAVGTDPDDKLIDGILGADFLSKYDIDLDLPDHKIRLFKAVSGCSKPGVNLEEPLYSAPLVWPNETKDARAHVRVSIGGKNLDAIVDSGAESSAIFRDSARKLGLRLADLGADRHGHASGIGPKARDTVQHIMAPITVGEITIANLPVSIIDERSGGDADMLLGLDFMARVHVWLSFSSRTMVMQYPPKASPVLPGT